MLHSSELLQIFLRGHKGLKQHIENKNCRLLVERNTSLITEMIFSDTFLGEGKR